MNDLERQLFIVLAMVCVFLEGFQIGRAYERNKSKPRLTK